MEETPTVPVSTDTASTSAEPVRKEELVAQSQELNPRGNPVYSLYNGTIQLEFATEKHQYFANGKYVPSVTGVTKYLDKSGPLMYWAVNKTIEYYKEKFKAGTVVDEVQLENIHREAKGHFRTKTQEAAAIGTLIHAWVEDYINAKMNGGEGPADPINERVKNGVKAFLDWESKHKIEYVRSESKIYSKKLGYSGTCDLIAKVNGKLSIVDFKTGSGPYYEHVLQTAAYQNALTEELGWKFKERWIIKFGKDDGEFEVHQAMLYKEDIKAFKALLEVYHRHLLGVCVKEKPKRNYEF